MRQKWLVALVLSRAPHSAGGQPRGGAGCLFRQLEAEGAAELVLDLRDNRGGLVQEGIEIAKLFLPGNAHSRLPPLGPSP